MVFGFNYESHSTSCGARAQVLGEQPSAQPPSSCEGVSAQSPGGPPPPPPESQPRGQLGEMRVPRSDPARPAQLLALKGTQAAFLVSFFGDFQQRLS